LILDVCLNENELTKEITDKIHYQFSRNEKHYPLDQKNIRFTYEDIKDYFVYLDVHLLSLLNAEDGVKDITAAEKALLDSAERLNLDGILKAVSDGANINAIDDMGETAITKVIRASRYDFHPLADKEAFEKFQRETPEFTNEEKIMVAQKLLDMGADINFFGPSGINGLLETTYNHNPVLMKFLLDKGANPNFNYHPEDGMEWIKSDPLYNVMGDYCCYDGDEKTLEEMEALLRNAGAKN
jgi:ankyrin repeat protein